MSSTSRLLVGAALSAALLGCDPTNKPTMNPGQDCMTCHVAGGQASSLPWSAAGTVFKAYDSPDTDGVQGVHVLITDALGKSVSLHTNQAGNFYTAEPLTQPLSVYIDYNDTDAGMITQPTATMIYGPDHPQSEGIGCNGCHQPPTDTTFAPFLQAPPPPGGGPAPLGRIALPGAKQVTYPDAGI